MTTIKEYKAIMDGATDEPWEVIEGSHSAHCCFEYSIMSGKIDVCEMLYGGKKDADSIVASRNIVPELIRVIELAEEALESCGEEYYKKEDMIVQVFDKIKIENAMLEIRKLKG